MEESTGIIYTRTGRRFFDDDALERAILDILRTALTDSGFWDTLQTDWACLDCELMPWSAKAQELIRHQYASVAAAARAALPDALEALRGAAHHQPGIGDLLARYDERALLARRYEQAYQRYSWPVHSIADLRLAPFHVMATEGAAHVDKDHQWHMQTLTAVCSAAQNVLFATQHHVIDVTDSESEARGIKWWEKMTERGGEGMVVKPLSFIARGNRGLVQPAVKCRGREYLRIIYGPEYTLPENLERLRSRGLATKRSLALREFALGVEGLERFVRKEPLRRVHECVFGVLALESEPVDPRL
jgi:protein phosphatase